MIGGQCAKTVKLLHVVEIISDLPKNTLAEIFLARFNSVGTRRPAFADGMV